MQAPATFDVLISYRRQDTRADAGRIYNRLSAHFGDDRILMDIDDIGPGQNCVDVLDRTLAHCSVLLVLIAARRRSYDHGQTASVGGDRPSRIAYPLAPGTGVQTHPAISRQFHRQNIVAGGHARSAQARGFFYRVALQHRRVEFA